MRIIPRQTALREACQYGERIDAIVRDALLSYRNGNLDRRKGEIKRDITHVRRNLASVRDDVAYYGLKRRLEHLDAVESYVNGMATSSMLDDLLDKLFGERALEREINNKYPKSDIVYVAREDSVIFDVRNFITPRDCLLQEIGEEHRLRGQTHDETMFRVFMHVLENTEYISDKALYGFNEQWDFPAEVLAHRKNGRYLADCEGGTNLIVSLARVMDVPAFRIKNCCGLVDDGSTVGGHSWPIYLRELDNKWVSMDWSVYPNTARIGQRELAKDISYYSEIWFTFNDQYAWAQKNMKIDASITQK